MSEEKQRRSHFHKLKKILVDVDNVGDGITLTEVNHFLEQTRSIMEKIESYHESIISMCVDEAAETVQNENYDQISDVYRNTTVRLMDIRENIIKANPNPQHNHFAAPGGSTNVKLPSMELPSFAGAYDQWTSFKDLFKSSIEGNKDLADSQKLQYLKTAVKDEPAALIRSLTITNANYKEAWDILNERYENTREITSAVLKRLFGPKALVGESANDLQKLLDNTNDCIRALKQLELPVEHWDCILVYFTTNKLDSNTRREFAKTLRGTTNPTYKQLTDFLLDHIRGLQASGTLQAFQRQPVKHDKKQINTHHSSSSDSKCNNCSGNHYLQVCPDFTSKTPSERSTMVMKLKLCFNCLRHHKIVDCKSKFNCKKCGKKHNTMLHVERPQQKPQDEATTSNQGELTTHYAGTLDTQVLLSTAVVKIRARRGGDHYVRLFMDSGSEGTFMTEDCASRLGLERHHSQLIVKGISSASAGVTKGMVNCTLVSCTNNQEFPISAHILPKVTGLLPRVRCTVRDWAHMQGLQLADPKYYEPGPIDILIGNNYIGHIYKTDKRIGRINSPVAYDTIFGWVISGNVQQDNSMELHTHHIQLELDDIVKRFWEIEEPPKVPLLTKDEKLFEDIYVQGYSKTTSGRYIVPLPFTSNKNKLGLSRQMAINRWKQVERRLQRNPEYQQQYSKFMNEYEDMGHMEKINAEDAAEIMGETYYLPHHFVLNQDSTTTKFRIVFDGSAKTTSGLSLNDVLLVGATQQDSMYDILFRFRIHAIVLKADVAKMFRQFLVNPKQTNFQRIVWRPTPDSSIQDYRLLTVTYGTGCATALATRTIQQLSKDSVISYPLAALTLRDDVYVDDILTGAETVKQALELQQELSSCVSTAGLDLRKWSTNCKEVLEKIPEELREVNSHDFDKDHNIKALGVQWNPSSDTFSFCKFQSHDITCLTKRTILAELSRVFDPIGFLSAITIVAKLIMQALWKLPVGWDNELPDDIQLQWKEYANQLTKIREIHIPRRITIETPNYYEIHGFSDASERAYGAVVYLRAVHLDGKVSVSFITSKGKVAPLKQITLARLELCGAVLCAKLLSYVHDVLKLECKVCAWTDSTIVLRWIAANPRRWQTFVANRVAAIQECTEAEQWRHVPGAENPADLVSRGVSPQDIIQNKFWFEGPPWLSNIQLPVFPINQQYEGELEERKVKVLSHAVETVGSTLQRFSKLSKLTRVTAYIFRFINRLKTKQSVTGPLTIFELKHALNLWIKLVQQQYFKIEIKNILEKKPVPSSSKSKSLYPFVDSDGILRVGGRLQNANLPENITHPVILPSNNHLTILIVNDVHLSLLHSGFQLTWSRIRANYWIIQGRSMVRHIVRKCVRCRRFRAQTAEQLMAPLPAVRTSAARPFLNTGVDYAGPFSIKNCKGRSKIQFKCYMCLFICMATKAIHLEVVGDLSTEAFIASFRRFVARRGYCKNLYSDCGTNFVGAEKELKRLFNSQQHNQAVSEHLTSIGVQFNFSGPSSPHHGGLWEAGVKSAKFHLKRVMGDSVFSFEQLQTVFCQVEAVLNSRPLCALSSDPTDLNPLTPGHFLIGEALTAVPEEPLTSLKENRLSIYQRIQQRVQHFWKRWQSEYLNTLQQRNKWFRHRGNLMINDMVIIKEDNTSPGQWKVGRIIDTNPGKDGDIRKVVVKTSTGNLKRPIVKLIALFDRETN